MKSPLDSLQGSRESKDERRGPLSTPNHQPFEWLPPEPSPGPANAGPPSPTPTPGPSPALRAPSPIRWEREGVRVPCSRPSTLDRRLACGARSHEARPHGGWLFRNFEKTSVNSVTSCERLKCPSPARSRLTGHSWRIFFKIIPGTATMAKPDARIFTI